MRIAEQKAIMTFHRRNANIEQPRMSHANLNDQQHLFTSTVLISHSNVAADSTNNSGFSIRNPCVFVRRSTVQ